MLCQLNELFQTDVLGPKGPLKSALLESWFQIGLIPVRAQEFEHHLPALRKAALHDFHKRRPKGGGKQWRLSSAQCHTCRIHLGSREEASRWNFKATKRLVLQLDQKR